VEDEAVEGHSRIHPDDQVSEPAAEAEVSGAAMSKRAALRREAAILAVLAITGAVIEYPLALTLNSLDLSELGRALPFLGVTLVLAALIPLALRLNGQLGLPGAPLLAAKIAGEKLHFSIRSLLKVSFGYALLAAIAGATVLAIIIVPLWLISRGSGGLKLPKMPMMEVAPGRLALFGDLVAIVAAVSEEIQFRLVLYAILGWVARLVSSDSRGHPGRGALWIVTFAQGYAFGLIHLAPLAGSLFHSTSRFLLGGLLMPQTWEGMVFGRLYLRRGLEASIIAHGSMDAVLFVFAAVAMRVHLGAG
jgi:hypothetical protein